MTRISRLKDRKRMKKERKLRRDEDGRHFKFARINRSHYPKPYKWMIFAFGGAVLLWLVARFFLALTNF